jgi:hypothetical protein
MEEEGERERRGEPAASGTRNRPWKSVRPFFVKTSWISHGQIEFATRAPMPRIITLKRPWALERTSFGK